MDPSRVIRKRAVFAPNPRPRRPKPGEKVGFRASPRKSPGKRVGFATPPCESPGERVGFAASPRETPGGKVGFASSPRRSPGGKVGFTASPGRSPGEKVGFYASPGRSPDPRGRSDLCVPWEGDRRPLSREIPRNSGPGGLQKKFQNLRKNILTFFDFRL